MALEKVTVPDSILIRWTDDNKIGSQFVSITHITDDGVIMPGQSRLNDPEPLTQERLVEVLSTADAAALIRVEVLEQEVSDRDQQITKLEEAVSESTTLIAQMQAEGNRIVSAHNELVEAHNAVVGQNTQLQEQLDQLLPDFQVLQAERDRLRTEVVRLEKLVEQYENEKFGFDRPTNEPVPGEDHELKS